MANSKSTRELLLEQLEGRNAHISFADVVDGLTVEIAGTRIDGLPHTIWDLIEHIRIAQADIIEFSKNPEYEAMNWPDDYWPESHEPANEEVLNKGIEKVEEGIDEMANLVRDPNRELQTPFDHGDGQTLFREAMLIVDHNAYHIGQIVQLRRLLNDW